MSDTFTISHTSLSPATEVRSGRFRLEKGTVPSAGQLVVPIQTIANPLGTLTFAYTPEGGSTTSIVLPDCLIVDASFITEQPGVVMLTVLDRRWRWQFGHIDGSYNIRIANNEYRNEKTPTQLVSLLLDAMGETGYDITAVDDATRPLVDWRGDSPARLLSELLYDLGLELTITAGNVVKLVKQGVGSTLPSGPALTASWSIAAGALPSSVRVACENIRYQCKFKLEAVGLEANGDVQPLDELSYNKINGQPANRFDEMTWPVFPKLDEEDRPLARLSVYKWYRIKEQAHTATNWAPPGFVGTPADIDSRDKILPLLPQLNKENIDLDTNLKLPAPAEVTGVYYRENDLPELAGNTDAGTKYPLSFSIDETSGIVKFSRPVFQIQEDGGQTKIAPADLRLECVVEVDDPDTNTKQYYAYTKGAGGGSGVYTVDRTELIPKVTPVYDGDTVEQHDHDSDIGTPDVDNITTNFADLDTEAEKFADVEIAALAPQGALAAAYLGFIAIELDGIRQFTEWSGSTLGPCVTQASVAGAAYARAIEEEEQGKLDRRRARRKRTFEIEGDRSPTMRGQP